MQKAGERAKELALVVAPGQVRVAGERDEARIESFRADIAPCNTAPLALLRRLRLQAA